MDIAKVKNGIENDLEKAGFEIPANYSVGNALKHAQLILSETVDKNKKKALDVCTRESIYNCLMQMVTQGLNPGKEQCYFVVFGSQLQIIRSYMGSQMIAKMVDKRIKDIRSEIVYHGDEFKFKIQKGKKVITQHNQTIESMAKADIVGAYAVAVDEKENNIASDIMTINEIRQSWKQSRTKVFVGAELNKDGTHFKFTGEMCKRTVINRLCKKIINTSDDEGLLYASKKTDEDRDIEEDLNEDANSELIDFKEEENESEKEVEVKEIPDWSK